MVAISARKVVSFFAMGSKPLPHQTFDDESPIDRFVIAIRNYHKFRNHENKKKLTETRVVGGEQKLAVEEG